MSQATDIKAEIGILGGTGFYSFAENIEEIEFETPYGKTSDNIKITEIKGRRVAFIPRHGSSHQHPPHKINYQANLFAFKKIGISQIISPFASGSLQPGIEPGDIVFVDQFIDRTCNRKDTFYDGPALTHVSLADPYCPELREIGIKEAEVMNISYKKIGTVVVVNGPRFSTRAESNWYSRNKWEIINMTQYPEVALARELEMCYLGIAIVTDYDVGLKGRPDIKPVSVESAIKILKQNNEKIKDLILGIIPKLPNSEERNCICANALKEAQL